MTNKEQQQQETEQDRANKVLLILTPSMFILSYFTLGLDKTISIFVTIGVVMLCMVLTFISIRYIVTGKVV